jgi:hypothetical protein
MANEKDKLHEEKHPVPMPGPGGTNPTHQTPAQHPNPVPSEHPHGAVVTGEPEVLSRQAGAAKKVIGKMSVVRNLLDGPDLKSAEPSEGARTIMTSCGELDFEAVWNNRVGGVGVVHILGMVEA